EPEHFTVDKELLKSVYVDYPWTFQEPTDPGKKTERQRLEQALFARTADESRHPARDALIEQLLPYLDNDQRALRVMERPDWERLIENSQIPEDVRTVLLSGDS